MKNFRVKKTEKEVRKQNFAYNIRNYVSYTNFIIILTTVLATVGGAYYAIFYTPKYKATTFLSSQMFGSLTAVALSTDKGIPIDDKETAAPRQLELIQTDNVLTKTAQKLLLFTEVESLSGKKYLDQLEIASLYICPSVWCNKVTVKTLGKDEYLINLPTIDQKIKGVVGKVSTLTVNGRILFSIDLKKVPASSGITYVLNQKPRGEVLSNMLSSMQLDAPGVNDKLVTNLIRVSYTGTVPEDITNIVNAIASVAVEESKEEERTQALQNLELMTTEREHIQDKLSETGEKLAALNENLKNSTIHGQIEAKLNAGMISELELKISESEALLASLEESSTSKNPIVKKNRAALSSYQKKRATLTQHTVDGLQKGHDILNLERDLAVYTVLYEDICRDCQQFLARVEKPVGNLRVVEAALMPDTPVSYSRLVIILLSAFIGFVSGYILALVLD